MSIICYVAWRRHLVSDMGSQGIIKGGCLMNAHTEKRSTKRFTRHSRVEVRRHDCSDWCTKGELIDCSEGGVGFFLPEPMKRGGVILLRVCQKSPHDKSHWPQEAGQFNMITAKVRWCLEGCSAAGTRGFRVGAQHMLPFY